jgi:hypothetical protein
VLLVQNRFVIHGFSDPDEIAAPRSAYNIRAPTRQPNPSGVA